MLAGPMRFSLLVLVFGFALGCSPAIGDSCSTAFDCSITGDRVCDTARPSGACTVYGCEADNCPEDAVCVRFRPEESRLAFTACMRRCEVAGHCRVDQGFACMAAEEILDSDGVTPLAEVVDEDVQRFCVATDPDPSS
jgi:hypothetical protein